jgi:hypothetical protein
VAGITKTANENPEQEKLRSCGHAAQQCCAPTEETQEKNRTRPHQWCGHVEWRTASEGDPYIREPKKKENPKKRKSRPTRQRDVRGIEEKRSQKWLCRED